MPQHPERDDIGAALALQGLKPSVSAQTAKKAHPEKILVLPSEALEGYPKWQGYRQLDALLWSAITSVDDKEPTAQSVGMNIPPRRSRLDWQVRDEIEENPGWRQIIPYVVLTHADQILVYRRPDKNVGDERLRGKMSCGVGGHVELADGLKYVDPRNWIQRATFREIDEEIVLSGDDLRHLRCVGVIRDDSNAVGQCHLGIVYHCPVRQPAEVKSNSAEVIDLAWIDAVDFLTVTQSPDSPFESWSHIVARNLYSIIKS